MTLNICMEIIFPMVIIPKKNHADMMRNIVKKVWQTHGWKDRQINEQARS